MDAGDERHGWFIIIGLTTLTCDMNEARVVEVILLNIPKLVLFAILLTTFIFIRSIYYISGSDNVI